MIEGFRLPIFGMDDHGADASDFSGMTCPRQGVAQQTAAQDLALVPNGNCQARQWERVSFSIR
jgi:hypothetical protein